MTAVVLGKLVGDGLLACLGVAGNAFILSSNAWHFWSGAREKPGPFLAGEMTVSCVAVANLLMDLTGFLWFVIKVFHLECLIGNAANMCVNYTLIVTAACSFWFTNCLCVFYMVNIISVPNAFFIRVKRNISVLTYTLLVITFTFNCVLTIPLIWPFQLHQTNISEANGNLSVSACNVYVTNDIPVGVQILNGFLLLYLPAGTMVYACVRIVVYLRHHIEKMERSSSSEKTLSSCSSSPALQAQIRISRMITCLVIVYMLCDTVLFLVILNRLFHENTDLIQTFAAFAISTFTGGIAPILIFGNSNLRKNLMSVCCPASEPTHVDNKQ
ncbi:taste receptor type 2 member 103-like [Acipenser oxyrinchus oxyrinchus]|uniref:Taste receptor type 2 n=1 Tax=Acipenser oxyrinchus oxyrinchus TaxID=40147 RepID=A0AAD8GJ05_ACIOX|nr:taste receptor type 2 member 103-like [Acipenser oxyrinchus oxyrinchus]